MSINLLYSDILNIIMDFLEPCDEYILLTYFPFFRTNNKKIFMEYSIMNSAIKSGNLALCKLLDKSAIRKGFDIIGIAAKYNKVEILNWMYERGYYMHPGIMEIAAFYGHLDILNWGYNLFDHNYNINPMLFAVGGDHQDIVKWLYNKGFKLKISVFQFDFNEITSWINGDKWDIDLINLKYNMMISDL